MRIGVVVVHLGGFSVKQLLWIYYVYSITKSKNKRKLRKCFISEHKISKINSFIKGSRILQSMPVYGPRICTILKIPASRNVFFSETINLQRFTITEPRYRQNLTISGTINLKKFPDLWWKTKNAHLTI